ncbi:tRNA modification GTPase gtpbp3, mitochondrial [Mortierella claussenii]|nr:tRNA modification GTPase gtpbp3, mitochondrial [Mortierella claussenii]
MKPVADGQRDSPRHHQHHSHHRHDYSNDHDRNDRNVPSNGSTVAPHPTLHPTTTVQNDGALTVPHAVDSSAMSVLSASGTLVAQDTRDQVPSTSPLAHTLSRTSTVHTLTPSLSPSLQQQSLHFDPQAFKSTLNQLNEHLEHFEALNDQLLDALTSFDESRLGLKLPLAPSIDSSSGVSSASYGSYAQDLEEQRRMVAQTFVDLVMDLRPRLYQHQLMKPANVISSHEPDRSSANYCLPLSPPMQMQSQMLTQLGSQQQQQQHCSSKVNKQRMKATTQLKQTIVDLLGAQNLFQEKAQLVLDAFEDPTELEHDDRLRSLRSRHLENLLSTTLSAAECDRLVDKMKTDQEKMALITDKLQNVWLGMIWMLENPPQASPGPMKTAAGGVGAKQYQQQMNAYTENESLGQKLVRMGKNKRQAFKVIIHSKARSMELRYTNTHLDTIFALSTHPGKAGIAVIRVSGPQAKSVLRSMTSEPSPLPRPRHAVTRRLVCPQSKELLDKGMVIWFPGPRSFTGEDSVEFHCHGGKAVVDGVLRAIGNVGPQVRLAEAGEFARRAFENDKLDLTEVEGLADLLNAETEAQRRLALRQADGGLKNLYDSWRMQLIKSMALIEALIDFGEDENIEDDVYDNVVTKVSSLYSEIKRHTNDDRRGEILRDGIHVTILGPPNAGKSSFLNFITKRQAAIVSPIPGTTRDVVEVSLDIGGYPILVGDTAGLRSSQDEIEMEGVRRAQDRINLADINIAILPVTEFFSNSTVRPRMTSTAGSNSNVDPIVLEAIRRHPRTMVLINKIDLSGANTERIMSHIRSQLWPEVGRDHGKWEGDHVVHSNNGDDSNDISHNGIQGNVDETDSNERRMWAISCETGDGIAPFLQDFIRTLKDR